LSVGIIKINKDKKTVKICVKSAELREILEAKEKTVEHQSEGVTWHPEFGGWMIESTPSRLGLELGLGLGLTLTDLDSVG
jgi:hypothetical protein